MIYNFLRVIIYIILFFVCIFDRKKREFIKKRFSQNFEFLKSDNKYFWIHCSSVGEVNLTDSLVKKILEKKDEEILISTFTDTGYETAIKKYSVNNRVKVIYFPLDDYFIINKILKTISLKGLILIETEIWPNLINLAYKKGKIFSVNGRISDKSYKKYLKIKGILKSLLTNKIEKYYVQTEIDKERFESLGATPEKVIVTGNLKFDIELQNYSFDEKEQLKKVILAKDKKIFVAGSTRTGEDEIIIEALKKLEDYLLVLVPRHLDRIPKLESTITNMGINYKKFSELEEQTNIEEHDYKILIVDKMGVLRKFYSIADISFVGGTLVNIGGHSLLEPLFYRKTPIFGEYLQNVKDIAKEILRREIGYEVKNSDEIYEIILKIEKENSKEKEIEEFFNANKNVAEKIVNDL
ncbi:MULTISPECIES: 3-deoxy-D-manno-octulosonic acid transferase [Fusobacterium]|uniref:3-deoxy-D-manno-octulosonic acid transferase n=1 Tax=Fusobacterium TaxID=848 RepID=UPI001476B5B9|nr:MULTISPECIES: glycosyltransferase N-terminal domain-containing protein [Fusobacterium]NME36079.1 3-deoxy-D-manno-octulosonic acid transferase [Fusobacterium sp. FSA-380-WT-3A]